jgi:drug/metabolite transporter (DMT)-like permease
MALEIAARTQVRLSLAFGAVYLVWGSTYLAIAFAIQSIPPFLMLSGRFLLAGGALYLWARWRGNEPPRARQWAWAFLLGGLFLLIGNGTVGWAEQRLSSGLTALIVALVSVWTALLEWIRPGGRRPDALVIAGIILGFLGVVLLVVPGQVGGGHVDPVAVLALVGSTFAWALASVLSRNADLPASTPLVSGMEMLAGGLLLLVASVVAGEWTRFDPGAITLRSGVSFAYLVLFGSLVTFTAYAWLLQVSTPNKAATAGYVNPMVAVFLGWLLGGEALTPRSLVAFLVIVAGVVLIITGREIAEARFRRVAAASDSPSR